ncbi:MAG: PDZ domain-containing protein [Myxococcales bacterium]|nr:PDZ domain-containing protein [Myxococcales bacterium]
MPAFERLGKVVVIAGAFASATYLAQQFGAGGLWRGFDPSLALAQPGKKADYDLTRLEAVNETLKYIRDRYVEPERVKPREMLMSALNNIQREVAEVIVLPDENGVVAVRVDTQELKLRVDNVLGPWDVAAKLRQVFAFVQKNLKDTDIDLRDVEYAACNGMLRTLDPHSVFMSPESYREMNLSTSGHFGGLGIVISMRDQQLTIVRPMPDTPAGRAGLKKGDRVTKINNESTLNMPLDDAVKRLRGKPGTKVTIFVTREGADGWQGEKKFELEREDIEVASVEGRRLDGDVGYVRLKQFQQTTEEELRAALKEMRSAGPLRGLVLDLRGNPGGLLEQAARVSDVFLEKGVLVATVGASEGREEKKAEAAGTEPDYPIVVLVSGTSASASEIVAGALKNLNRAVIVGQTTFGKGSVQLVFPEVTRDHAALKLTIAQYLTPGDKSIQGVGVTPHVELDPMTVDDLELDITTSNDGVKERDLSQHLSNSRATQSDKALDTVRYYLPREERLAQRERGGEIDEDFQVDFPISFGRDLVLHLPAQSTHAEQDVKGAQSFIDEVRAAETKKLAAELGKLGVDWSLPEGELPPGPAPGELEVKASTDRPNDEVLAGEPLELVVSVTNRGKQPVHRLHATTESDGPYFDERELVFGRIGPGETRVARAPLSWCELAEGKPGAPKPDKSQRKCRIPMDALTRSDGVKIRFDAATGSAPVPVELRPTIRAIERPLFEYSYQVVDTTGNGDGVLQRGETATMYLDVRNVGRGRSYDTQANLANKSGDGLLLRKGRFDISNLMPGEARRVAFSFDVEPQLVDNEVVLGLSVGDRDLREFASEKLRLAVEPERQVTPANGTVAANGRTLLFTTPGTGTEAFGEVKPGTLLPLVGQVGNLGKVALGPARFAFVRLADTSPATGAASDTAEVAFEQLYSHAPPMLNVRVDSTATRDDKVRVHIDASDSKRVLDVYMFVGARKVFYQSNRDGSDPRSVSFEVDAPLRPGVNSISVVARENADTSTRRTVIVRRDAPDGALQKTPKTDDDFLLEEE